MQGQNMSLTNFLPNNSAIFERHADGMNLDYTIDDTREIITPALILFHHLLESNIDDMIRIAGDAARLRPHCKTHKMAEVIRLELARNCQAQSGDVCRSRDAGRSRRRGHLSGLSAGRTEYRPNRAVCREVSLMWSSVCSPITLFPSRPLSKAMSMAGRSVDVLLDIDTGQHRTGIEVGSAARSLYEQIARAEGLTPGGLHVYDGHQHQTSRTQRAEAIHAQWRRVIAFRDELVAAGFAVPRILAGGTGSFPVYAEMDDSTVELSPGTCVFHDHGYGQMFPDLAFTPAAVLLIARHQPTDRRSNNARPGHQGRGV